MRASRAQHCSNWNSRAKYQGGIGANIRGGLAIAGPLVLYNLGGSLAYHRIRSAAFNEIDGPLYAGAPAIIGEPAAVETNGKVRAYFIKSDGRLAHMEYDDPSRSWSFARDEFWEDGSPIISGLGIAVAHGAVQPEGAGIFAAIPNAVGVTAGKPLPIEFARLITTTQTITITVPPKTPILLGHPLPTIPGYTYSTTVQLERWQRFSAATRVAAAQFAKPGLTYSPFDLATPDDGRFYMTFVPGDGGQPRTARIMFTEGNDTRMGATSRKLVWKTGQQTLFADDEEQSRDFSRGVVLARFGASVMAATSTLRGTNFFTAADGIIDMDIRDYPDMSLVLRNLACSVRGGGDVCPDSP